MENSLKKNRKLILTLLLVLYFFFGYMPIDAFNSHRTSFHTLGFPFEARIPFLAPFIFGYSLVYGSAILIYWAVPNWEVFKKLAWGYFWVTTIHYIIFLLFPVKMIWRPEIIQPTNFAEWTARFIFSLDKPYNLFPSLHVAYPTLVTVIAWRWIPKMKFWFLAMAIITAISVVLVKQHYILDVVGGAATAILIGAYTSRSSSQQM